MNNRLISTVLLDSTNKTIEITDLNPQIWEKGRIRKWFFNKNSKREKGGERIFAKSTGIKNCSLTCVMCLLRFIPPLGETWKWAIPIKWVDPWSKSARVNKYVATWVGLHQVVPLQMQLSLIDQNCVLEENISSNQLHWRLETLNSFWRSTTKALSLIFFKILQGPKLLSLNLE